MLVSTMAFQLQGQLMNNKSKEELGFCMFVKKEAKVELEYKNITLLQ